MPSIIPKNISKKIALIFIMLGAFFTFSSAQELGQSALVSPEDVSGAGEKATTPKDTAAGLKGQDLSELQKQARDYRNQGFQLQGVGDLDKAMSLYQKAIEMDPLYAVAYNDLAVIYETKGQSEKAEDLYLKAIQIDPFYLSAYSNLAILYENRGDFEKASLYWSKRVSLAKELGLEDDPWTEKAKLRLEVLGWASGETSEYQLIDFMKEVARRKTLLRQSEKELAKEKLEKAKRSFKKQDYATALKEAINARQLDPANTEIVDFLDKVQIRALSR